VTSIPGNVSRIQPRTRLGDTGLWVFDRVAEAIDPLPLRPDVRLRLRERVMTRFCDRASNTQTIRSSEGEWRSLAPGVTIKLLRHDASADNMTAFIRMLPGTSLDAHAHTQGEECLVVAGEIFIGRHRLGAGDMHVAAAGTVHEAITSPRGALLLVRAQSV
jgi:quercetin dioxygenase-like cupin family protein